MLTDAGVVDFYFVLDDRPYWAIGFDENYKTYQCWCRFRRVGIKEKYVENAVRIAKEEFLRTCRALNQMERELVGSFKKKVKENRIGVLDPCADDIWQHHPLYKELQEGGEDGEVRPEVHRRDSQEQKSEHSS